MAGIRPCRAGRLRRRERSQRRGARRRSGVDEREGSEIGRQIIGALLDEGTKVGYVTHLFDLADRLHADRGADAVFLRAERLPDGRRTFRLIEGEPLPTSHGQDIYRRIFGGEREVPARAGEVA